MICHFHYYKKENDYIILNDILIMTININSGRERGQMFISHKIIL